MMEEFVTQEMENFIHEFYMSYKSESGKWGELKKLLEFEFLLDEFLDMAEVDPIDRINLERISNRIADKVRFDKIIFYFSSFHYFYNCAAYSKGEIDVSKKIYQINIQINIMRIQIKHKMVNGCSEDDYFFEGRGGELLDAVEIICNKGPQFYSDYNALLYMTLNYVQALLEYIESGESRYYKSSCELADKGMKIVQRISAEIKNTLDSNIKLKLFMYSIKIKYRRLLEKSVKNVDGEVIREIDQSCELINNIWAAMNIYDLDKNYFDEYFGRHLSSFERFYEKLYGDSKIVYLRCCLRWMKENQHNIIPILKLPTIKDGTDKSWFDINAYINGYDESAKTDISDEEIACVQSYNDEVLREKIANILINIDKHIIERECHKPHGGFEISDMELPIRRSYAETYYLCIPVKSGVEIAKKVTEDIVYQVIRPFTFFGHRAIVVFISAKEATENFYNYLKRAKVNLDFEIYDISGKALVKLLKYNNQI